MSFINFRQKLLLTGAARGVVGSFSGCLYLETGLKDKLVCHFKLAAGMVEGGVRESVYDADGTAFLKRELGAGGTWRGIGQSL